MEDPPPIRPHLPSHKQTRITIWRDEVASLTSTPRPPCSSAQSTTTTTSSSSSGGGSSSSKDIFAAAATGENAPRKRDLWRRLTKRIRGKDEEPQSGAVMNGLHTEMYKEELGTWQVVASPGVDEVSSQGGKGLKDKQERLERAARLLNDGADKS